VPERGVIMCIRKMNDGEFPVIIRLINETVHSVCAKDYTKKELDAWAPGRFDTSRFIKALSPTIL
jgi:putative acetyltransferase